MFSSYGTKPLWSGERYSPVPSLDGDDSEKLQYELSQRRRPRARGEWLKNVTLVFLVVAVGALSVLHWQLQFPGRQQLAALKEKATSYIDGVAGPQYIPFRYLTEYSPDTIDDLDRVDDAWEALRPAFGIVAVSHDWAAGQGLLRADNLHSDADKGVYTIEGYHQLHCLILLRRTMFQLARGEELSAPLGHSMHCFDAMRQSIICQADDKLLYTRKGVTDGEGQPRKCRSWEKLRDWAAENSACYDDGHEGIKFENKTGCAERLAYGDGMVLS